MAQMVDGTYPAAARAADDPEKLRDEISRLSQRLVRARESYSQDLSSGDAEVPLDVQLSVIATYTARLESLTEQLRAHDAGPVAAEMPAQPPTADAPVTPTAVLPTPALAQVTPPKVPEPWTPQFPAQQRPAEQQPAEQQPPAPRVQRPAIPGPGITNPDGTPLVSEGSLIRTEEAALGEYVRSAAEQRWLSSTRPSLVGEYAGICDVLLAALAHKHGVEIEDERQSLVRHVDARYRRDYG